MSSFKGFLLLPFFGLFIFSVFGIEIAEAGVVVCKNTSQGSQCYLGCGNRPRCITGTKICWEQIVCIQSCGYTAGNLAAIPPCPGAKIKVGDCACDEGISCGINACPAGTSINNPYNLDPVGQTSSDCTYFNGSCTSNYPRNCMRRNVGRQNCYPSIPDIFAPIVRLGVDYNTSALGCTQDSVWMKNPESVESAGIMRPSAPS